MAVRGMGCATKGGGCVGSGPKNKMVSKTSKKTGPVMMKDGGDVNINLLPEDTPAEREYKRAVKKAAAEDKAPGSKPKVTSKRYGGMVKKMKKGGMC